MNQWSFLKSTWRRFQVLKGAGTRDWKSGCTELQGGMECGARMTWEPWVPGVIYVDRHSRYKEVMII